MTAEEEPEPRGGDALMRFLQGLGEHLREVRTHLERQHDLEENARAALSFAEHSGGMVVPMGVDTSGIPEPYAELLHGLLNEQGKASLFVGQLPMGHPYRQVFRTLSEAWNDAAAMGALHIAKHNIEHHDVADIQVGPEEFGAAWASIAVSAVLGAIRFGQEHPEAFKGLEGLKPGEIDDTVAQLIAWAAEEHRKGGEAAPEEA